MTALGGQALTTERARELIEQWKRFASDTQVTWHGHTRSWKDHITGDGFDDEVRLIQPVVFPAFAATFLGWETGVNLSPEQSGDEGRPDFTPADPVTHPFVFETKGSRRGVALSDPKDLRQVETYLADGRPRIQQVVLTNVSGIRVFALDKSGDLQQLYHVRLRDLLFYGEHHSAEETSSASNFVRFVDQFSRQELDSEQKIARIREAHPWQTLLSVTSSEWIMKRLDRVVASLQADVLAQLPELKDPARLATTERDAIAQELQLLGSRIGPDLDGLQLADFIGAAAGSAARVAVEQYAMHVAYYLATRLLLVRTWEDLGLLDAMLYDGGFDRQMTRFDDIIDVVEHSFRTAQGVYRSLFTHSNNYSWFTPTHATYVDTIYELAFTYLGQVDSDVLGQVYERLLSRIDRKLLGQYYTPRDIIALIWDLIGLDVVASDAEAEGRTPRLLDIATGSGGFLVEALSRLRRRLEAQKTAGAAIDRQAWLNEVALSMNGVEIQYFSRYLAELNLLVQLGHVVAEEERLRIAPIGVIAADTLSLHQPLTRGTPDVAPSDQPDRAARLHDVIESDFAMDVACGNPPYIGEKLAAPLLRRTRELYPYWREFIAEHQDYLYGFLIVGVSKLRAGGRFGFITTEYWLRAAGARPLRRYLASHCQVERIILFRDLKLFPDAPGQHSMVVTGHRVSEAGDDTLGDRDLEPLLPQVSIYRGPSALSASDRLAVLEAMRNGKDVARVATFRATVSPNSLHGESWADVVLTRRQIRQRARLKGEPQIPLVVSKGVETTLNGLTAKTAQLLPVATLASVGWPDAKAGIQLLTTAEVGALNLSEDEQKVVRPVINTKDVYPYAAIVEPDPTYVVYLVKPEAIKSKTPLALAQAWPMPDGIPSLSRHLQRFKPVLDEAVKSRAERRPWWTLHRPRFDVIGSGSADEWEPFCLTTRWGGGNRLVVGLAPGRASPASSLHILRGGPDLADAALLSAIYNSSVYQAIVDSLPPGNLRAEDLESVGMPRLDGQTEERLAAVALDLAGLVKTMVREDGKRFPLLADVLRTDITLSDPGLAAWTPEPGPVTQWGRLADVQWTERVAVLHGAGRPLSEVSTAHTLLGRLIQGRSNGLPDPTLSVEIAGDAPEAVLDVAAHLIRGATENKVQCGKVADLLVPLDPDELIRVFELDSGRLLGRVVEYRQKREEIDEILSLALDASAA